MQFLYFTLKFTTYFLKHYLFVIQDNTKIIESIHWLQKLLTSVFKMNTIVVSLKEVFKSVILTSEEQVSPSLSLTMPSQLARVITLKPLQPSGSAHIH